MNATGYKQCTYPPAHRQEAFAIEVFAPEKSSARSESYPSAYWMYIRKSKAPLDEQANVLELVPQEEPYQLRLELGFRLLRYLPRNRIFFQPENAFFL